MGIKFDQSIKIDIELLNKVSLNYSISTNNDCSFCDKKNHEVKKIFKGKYATICDECINLCEEIIDEKIEERIKSGSPKINTGTWNPACSFCLRSVNDPKILLLIEGNQEKYICDHCTFIFVDELKFI